MPDRAAARPGEQGLPDRAATLLAGTAGLRQFVDIGCGLPADDNLGDIVRRTDPSCRVAYVDNDPMVLAHARALLAVDASTGAFAGDVRDPEALLAGEGLRKLIDFGEPAAVFLLGVLDFLPDEAARAGSWTRWPPGWPPAATWSSPTPSGRRSWRRSPGRGPASTHRSTRAQRTRSGTSAGAWR